MSEDLKKSPYKVVNVRITKASNCLLSRQNLLKWVNAAMQTNLRSISELCTGALYCQFMDALFPGCINLRLVKFQAHMEHHRIENFKLLQKVFTELKITRTIPIQMLIRGYIQHNLEFLQWFSRFFDANYNEEHYDAIRARYGQVPRATKLPTALKERSSSVQMWKNSENHMRRPPVRSKSCEPRDKSKELSRNSADIAVHDPSLFLPTTTAQHRLEVKASRSSPSVLQKPRSQSVKTAILRQFQCHADTAEGRAHSTRITSQNPPLLLTKDQREGSGIVKLSKQAPSVTPKQRNRSVRVHNTKIETFKPISQQAPLPQATYQCKWSQNVNCKKNITSAQQQGRSRPLNGGKQLPRCANTAKDQTTCQNIQQSLPNPSLSRSKEQKGRIVNATSSKNSRTVAKKRGNSKQLPRFQSIKQAVQEEAFPWTINQSKSNENINWRNSCPSFMQLSHYAEKSNNPSCCTSRTSQNIMQSLYKRPLSRTTEQRVQMINRP